ncbi:unnamed protein product [Euphydryas editha]|uniref:Insulin-degrading enzyme n=1 Tax=Euphydryas editha TaxID=104508 RepID=A0AAU9UPS1_EUPED|nr:unnamed protein product [Euphydryas editha]
MVIFLFIFPKDTDGFKNKKRRLSSDVTVPQCTPRSPSQGQSSTETRPGTSSDSSTGVIKKYDDIVKSPNDKREYRGLQLANRLKVLLISDTTTDKSAAALDVNIGFLSDPDELPGLAHLCEHMLSLAIVKYDKYPNGIEFRRFLSTHGGLYYAFTFMDHTSYYFSLLPQHLAKVLDIFARLLMSPQFTEMATGRELSSINSEHQNNASSDIWRLIQLNKSTADPKHPYHKFGAGNKETLEIIPKEKGINVHKEVLKFHQKWYSSNIMTLIVMGKESLDELEKMVLKLFSAVEDKSVTAPTWPDHPFPPHLRAKRTYYYPVKHLRFLSIDFPIPDMRKHYKSGPRYYLSQLLEHKGPGSLLSVLKARGWSNNLIPSRRIDARGFAFFTVQVDLTEAGVDHIDEIVELVFQYIAMLKKQGPQRRVWEEQRDLLALEFRFRDAPDALIAVEAHAHKLQDVPMQDILSASYLMTEWRPDLIENLLELLTPDNVRVEVGAKCFEKKCTQTEPWYGTKYLQEDIDKETLAKWKAVELNPELHLPLPNEFIPARLELEKSSDPTADAIAPVIIKVLLTDTVCVCQAYTAKVGGNNYQWVHIEQFAVDVGLVYKPGDTNFEQFLKDYDSQLQQRKRSIVFGDYNINLLENNKRLTEYKNQDIGC